MRYAEFYSIKETLWFLSLLFILAVALTISNFAVYSDVGKDYLFHALVLEVVVGIILFIIAIAMSIHIRTTDRGMCFTCKHLVVGKGCIKPVNATTDKLRCTLWEAK